MMTQTVYTNGRYRVVQMVTLLAIEVEGRRLGTYDTEEIEQAVSEVDAMAGQDGVVAHCSM